MDLKDIMSVSGQSGLFRFVSQGRNGIIVESFTDNKRSFVSASHKVSSLADIAIFTDGEEVPLKDVLKSIHEMEPGVPAPDPKSSPDILKKFMEKILPNYDRERVYMSDIKKLASWYNSLLELKLLNFDESAPEETAKSEETVQTESKSKAKTAAAKPKKTTTPKRSARGKNQ
ncbi:MAG: DUF5606 domain-containing protein [Bacteroidales bacterium]|nr:DUF5606 domain-containing protein [Bacteroidales bacterium]